LEDPTRFLELLTTIDEADREAKPWPDYEYLPVLVRKLQRAKLLWIPKSRRILATWTICAFMLWEALSNPVYLGIIQSQTEEHSKKLLRDKIKVLWENRDAISRRTDHYVRAAGIASVQTAYTIYHLRR
jgi:hypothetical protein